MDAILDFLSANLYDPWWEVPTFISWALSVWLLARNRLSGWYVGLLGNVLYAVTMYRAGYYGEILIGSFFFVTTLMAIRMWHRGGDQQEDKPVGCLSLRKNLLCLALGAAGTLALWPLLTLLRGTAPFLDAFTTGFSFVAQIYMMRRLIECWPIWIVVDLLYIPLMLQQGLPLLAILYAAFVPMAIMGWIKFHHVLKTQNTEPNTNTTT